MTPDPTPTRAAGNKFHVKLIRPDVKAVSHFRGFFEGRSEPLPPPWTGYWEKTLSRRSNFQTLHALKKSPSFNLNVTTTSGSSVYFHGNLLTTWLWLYVFHRLKDCSLWMYDVTSPEPGHSSASHGRNSRCPNALASENTGRLHGYRCI